MLYSGRRGSDDAVSLSAVIAVGVLENLGERVVLKSAVAARDKTLEGHNYWG